MANIKFILASASPRRKELVGHLKIPFEIITSNVTEESHHESPEDFCRHIAQIKGEAVVNELLKKGGGDLFVVSADTIVALNGKIYGKPRDAQEAESFLSELSGKTHSVFTAVSMVLVRDGKREEVSFVDESKVTFENISRALMDNYLATKDSLDKAGAYGIQGPSLTFISKVEGSYSNVVGFPLSRFVIEAEKFLKKHFPREASWPNLFLS